MPTNPQPRYVHLAILLLLSALWPAAAAWAEESRVPGLAGHWEGRIVVREAEIESDFSVDIASGPEGSLTGTISVPDQGVQDRPLESVVEDKEVVSLVFRDESGFSIFNGTLSVDRKTITGELSEEAHKFQFPFVLERREKPAVASSAEPAQLHRLSENLAELKERFNADAGDVRLVLVLVPAQVNSLMSARLIRRYALDPLGQERLKVYAIWVAPPEGGSEEAARASSRHLQDPQVVHFYAGSPAASNAFKAPLGLNMSFVRDVFLVYAPGKVWGETVPAPSLLMHRSMDMPEEQRLNALKLADSLRLLVAEAATPSKRGTPPTGGS